VLPVKTAIARDMPLSDHECTVVQVRTFRKKELMENKKNKTPKEKIKRRGRRERGRRAQEMERIREQEK
jgi:hypothetical protein